MSPPGTTTVTATHASPSLTASTLVTVTVPPPTITKFDPTSGRVGDSVTLTGTNFFNVSSVAFNNVPVPVPVPGFTVVNSTTIEAAVPANASTGPLSLTTPGGTAASTGTFIVLPTQDFQLSVAPTTLTLPATGQGAFDVSLSGSGGYTGLTTLAVTGVPSGTTASFGAPALTAGQSTLLTLTTAGTTAAGSYPLTVTAAGLLNGISTTHSAPVTLEVQAAGQTVLMGQVRDEDDQPITGVSIKLGGATPTVLGVTDAGGNFLISNPPLGPQVLLVDGSTASTSGVSFPTIPVTVTVQAGVVNTLGFTPHLHAQPTGKLVPILSGQDTVLTDPDIPGFQMTIPAGVQIIGWDGQANNQVSVRALPIDRSPLPPVPPGQTSRVVYMFFFGKVGGGTPTGIVPIDTPNDVDGLPGEKVDLYFYNEAPDGTAPNQWEKYGTGTISPDGTRILTDINPATGKPYGIPRFCCGGRRNVPPPPPPRPGGGPSGGPGDGGDPGGEPVDLAMGFFYLTKTDLVLPGIVPLTITRTYRTNLTNAGPFGSGTSWPYDLFLQPPPNGSSDALILFTPGNRQDLFARQPDGTFINTTSPALRGAVVTVTGDGRALRYKDGRLFRFDPTGRLISQADRNGNTVTIVRDGQGRVTTLIEPRGRTLTLSYTGTNLQIDRITDPLGRTVQYSYDGSGRLISVMDPAGGVTRYTYDGSNRMLTLADPRGITFLTNEYDANGRVVKQTQADGGIWQFAYTTTGTFISQATVTDPRGNPTTSRFNSAGYLISRTDALGQTTTFTRQPGTNLLLSTTDPLGRVTRFTYDAQGNVKSITDPGGNTRTFTYEATFNRVTSITDPLGNVTRFAYDPQGNLTTITDPLGNTTVTTYNSFGKPESRTDPLGNTTTFGYNAQGDLVDLADPLGNTTIREFDSGSRLVSQLDPRGRATSFGYDALNHVTTTLDALGGTTTFGYDPNGNLLAITDPRGNTITYAYDAMNRLAGRVDQLGRVEAVSYDRSGNPVGITNRMGQPTTATYDALNRRIRTEFADGAVATLDYDAVGRVVRVDDTADPQRPLTLEYDLLNRVAVETTASGSVAYRYDALGRRVQMAVSGQPTVTYAYDANSRLRTVTQTPLGSVGIDYDALGRRTLLTLPNGISAANQYDAASRLTAIIYRNSTGPLGDLQYTYDPAGNVIGLGGSFARTLLPDPVAAAIHDAANQQLAFGDKRLTFDGNGNLTSVSDASGTMAFTWDTRGRLVEVSGPGVRANFAYDALSRRVRRTLNGQGTDYRYDGIDIATELAGGSAGATYLRSTTGDQPFIRQSTGNEYYLTDASGSVLALTNDAGNIQTVYTYEPFGTTQVSGASTSNPFQYTGRENDGTGLYYLRARYYSPSLHRFLSEDPVMPLDIGVNFYAYALNNPLLFIDPTGLQSWPTNFGRVTDPFGTPRDYGPHSGADIRNPRGEPTYATDSGTVRKTRRSERGGNEIIIDNDDGSVSGYAHTAPAPHIVPGQHVNEGEPVGTSDGSGGVRPHLHLTYRRCRDCPREDPVPRLPGPDRRPPPYGARGSAP